jgi:alcohol/geraniol dehydrogenase (NADP+)
MSNCNGEKAAFIGGRCTEIIDTLHTVGAVGQPINLAAFPLLAAQKSFSGSPFISPATTAAMFHFAARHRIEPTTEFFPTSKIGDAFEHLKRDKVRCRNVLENDLDSE